MLDFGLAKIGQAGPRLGPAKVLDDPTILHTREGTVIGTVPYMSPEQIAGRWGLAPCGR